MEQHIQSFTSFIQTVPPLPYPRPDRPLPPIPFLRDYPMSAQPPVSAGYFRTRTSSGTSWHVPQDWDGPVTPRKESQGSSSTGYREYSPLLPATSPELCDIQMENYPQPLQPPVTTQALMQEGNATGVPPLPPRNPFRGMSAVSISVQSDPGPATFMSGVSKGASQQRSIRRFSGDSDYNAEPEATSGLVEVEMCRVLKENVPSTPSGKTVPNARSLSWQSNRTKASLNSEPSMTTNTKGSRNIRKKAYRKISLHGHLQPWMHHSRKRSGSPKHSKHSPMHCSGMKNRIDEVGTHDMLSKDLPVSNLIARLKNMKAHGRRKSSHDDSGAATLVDTQPRSEPPPILPLQGISTPLLDPSTELVLLQESPPSSSPNSANSSRYGVSTPPGTPQDALDAGLSRPLDRSSLQNVTLMYSELAQTPYSPARSPESATQTPINLHDTPANQSSSEPHTSTSTTEASPHNTGKKRGHKRIDSATEEAPHVYGIHLGFLNMARDARQAWKKSRRDAKHDKLKQSIRLVGPADPALVAQSGEREVMDSRPGGDGSSRFM